MKRVLIDEFPSNTNVLLANDYNEKVIYRLIGAPLLQIKDKSIVNSQLNIFVKNHSLYIKALNNNQFVILEEVKKKIDEIYIKWRGSYKIFFIGIKKQIINGKVSLYDICNNGIVIKFNLEERIYPFLCLLSSHYFNCTIPNNNENINNNKNNIEVKSNKFNEIIKFIKIRNGYLNLILYKIGLVDMTSNTNFPNTLKKRFQNNKDYVSVKSGIECIIISTNKKSDFFHNENLRKYIFSLISDLKIQNKISCNVNKSKMYTTYRNSKSIEKNISISISYDDYYPNKIIVSEIKSQLKNKGINLKLVKSDYFNPKESADCRLYLFSNEFKDDIFKYYFLGLISSLRQDKKEYLMFMSKVKEYFNNEISLEQCTMILKDILVKNGIYFSVGEINSTFLSRNHQLDFIYYE